VIIPIGLPHVFYPGSDPEANAEVLKTTLIYLIAINRGYLRRHPRTPGLYESGVVYGRTVVWDSIPAVLDRTFGDCKSLTAWLIAERMQQGFDCQPVFRFRNAPDGQLLYHILVQTPDGFEDPSKVLGMGSNENAMTRRSALNERYPHD
jgi:hypothetical protein